MPISVQITAETAEEYREAMQVLAGLFLSRQAAPSIETRPVTYDKDELLERMGVAPADPEPEAQPETAVEDVTAELAKPKRARGRPRKAAEAAAEADTSASEADLSAQEADAPAEADKSAPEEAPSAPEPDLFASGDAQSGDPAKDKSEALDLLRALYDRDGMAPKINELLAGYGVAKFTLIPTVHGTDLLAQARQLDAENPA